MNRDSEKFGEPHTLIVHRDEDGLFYDLEHAPSCTKKTYTYDVILPDGSPYVVEEWNCDVAWHEGEVGLFEALSSSGTPVTEPGTYRIQGWSRKTFYHGSGYEHDAGIGLMEPEAAS